MASGTINRTPWVNTGATEVVTALRTQNGTYTPTKNGFLYISCIKDNDSNASDYQINVLPSNKVLGRYNADGKVYAPMLIPVQAGVTYKCVSSVNMYWADTPMFIPIE